MKKTFKHLSEEDRDVIAVQLGKGESIRAIARRLGRSHTSILRELKRARKATRMTTYLPHRAQEQADKMHKNAHRRPRLKTHALRHDIEAMLMNKWSPEIIAGRLKNAGGTYVCAESIYQWIYKDAKHLIGYLIQSHPVRRRRRFKRPRRIRIPERISITQRPAAILARQQPGHWETDLVVGRGLAALQVAIERRCRFIRIRKLPNKTATVSRQTLSAMLRPFPTSWRLSITYDNGLENTEHLQLNQELQTQSYFCEPYHSWEKGTVEHANGMIRWFFPKRTDFATISDIQIRQAETWLNNRPRKCLNFKTPAETLKLLGCCIST